MARATTAIAYLLLLLALIYSVQARQTRINRYTTEVDDDDDTVTVEVAEVKEVRPTGYPAAGQRPGRAFPLPGEEAEASGVGTTITTELPTTTAAFELDTTTFYNGVPAELNGDDLAARQPKAQQPKAPYPAAGYRPRIPFSLPTESKVKDEAELSEPAVTATTIVATTEPATTEVEVDSTPVPLAPFTTAAPAVAQLKRQKAPYPAAGYRPSRAFLLPSELKLANELDKPASGNANHPACGVSTNPLHPVPAKGEVENPDAERVLVTATANPAVASESVPREMPVRPLLELRARPLVVAPGRPFAYSAQFQTW